jgi:hypothetical protein
MVRRRLIRRLERAGAIVSQARAGLPAPAAPADESRAVAREMGKEFGELVGDYVKHFGKTAEEARAIAGLGAEEIGPALTGPPEQVSWHQLAGIAGHDPERAQARWQEVKDAARDEVASGHLAAAATEIPGSSRPWVRATFLAVREELLSSLPNPSGIERALIDQLAGYQVSIWEWQRIVAAHTFVVNDCVLRSVRQRQPYEPALVDEAEALENAQAMVERLGRLYLQTLKALQAQRMAPRVMVRNAGQVNVAHGPQLNAGHVQLRGS